MVLQRVCAQIYTSISNPEILHTWRLSWLIHYFKNNETKFEANPCSGSREEVEKIKTFTTTTDTR